MPGLDPPVIAAVEEPHVVNARVPQDHQGTSRGDLSRASTGPLLVRVALRVASIDDDCRVMGDAERSKRRLDGLGRPAVPVRGVLEPVGVEVERSRDMSVRVFLRHAEIDVEEDELASRSGLGPFPVEHLAEPLDVDELLVLGQPLDGETLVGRPGRKPGLEDPRALDAEAVELGRKGIRFEPIAIDHDVASSGDALGKEQAIDLCRIDAVKPRRGKGDGAGNVAAAGFSLEPPAVVGGDRSYVHDRGRAIGEASVELLDRNGRSRGLYSGFGCCHVSCPSSVVSFKANKNPCPAGVAEASPACGSSDRTPSYTTCPARQWVDRDTRGRRDACSSRAQCRIWTPRMQDHRPSGSHRVVRLWRSWQGPDGSARVSRRKRLGHSPFRPRPRPRSGHAWFREGTGRR